MYDTGAGASGWTTLSSGFALAIGFVVCIAVTFIVAKPLEARGWGRYLPWLMFGSFLLSAIGSRVWLSRHLSDKLVYESPDSWGAAK